LRRKPQRPVSGSVRGFPLTSSLAQSLRPYPQFTNIPVNWAPLGNSWYDALQVK